MEVPAKRASLSPRELKLLDLDDDALIMIIDKLNHKSKLQMMATCKRFEGLIGNTHQFFKNFKIRFDQEQILEAKEIHKFLGNIQRGFGIVEISGGNKLLSPPILELVKKIGADILKIEFQKLTICKEDFLELMKTLKRVEELKIGELQFPTETEPEEIEKFELEHLKKLEISGSTHLSFLVKFVPSTLQFLNFMAIERKNFGIQNCWESRSSWKS
jgi:hypothetical protein